jgi:hypothetical protein
VNLLKVTFTSEMRLCTINPLPGRTKERNAMLIYILLFHDMRVVHNVSLFEKVTVALSATVPSLLITYRKLI